MKPDNTPTTVPLSFALLVKMASINAPRIEPLANEPILLMDTIIESEIPPTKKEKVTITIPQNRVTIFDKISSSRAVLFFFLENLPITSYTVVALREFKVESRLDIAAENRATMISPMIPCGR